MCTVYSDSVYPTRKYFCFFSCRDVVYYKHYVAVFGLQSTFEFVVYIKVVCVRRGAAWMGLCSLELASTLQDLTVEVRISPSREGLTFK